MAVLSFSGKVSLFHGIDPFVSDCIIGYISVKRHRRFNMPRKKTSINWLTDWDEIADDLKHQSDRGCAIIASTLVQDSLIPALIARFNKQTEEFINQFMFDRPLGSFYIQTQLAYASGMIGDDIYNDLKYIREIRNAFAHNILQYDAQHKLCKISFSIQPIADWSSNLRCPDRSYTNELLKKIMIRLLEESKTRKVGSNEPLVMAQPRMRFLWTCQILHQMFLTMFETMSKLLKTRTREYHPLEYMI